MHPQSSGGRPRAGAPRWRPLVALLAIALLFVVPAPPGGASSTPTFVALTEFTDVASNCVATEVVHNSISGKSFAVWIDPDDILQGALVDSEGRVGTPVAIADTSTTSGWWSCEPVTAAAAPDGGWLVMHATRDRNNPAPVYGQRVASDGTLVGGELQLSGLDEYTDIETYTASWNARVGRYLLTWKAVKTLNDDPDAFESEERVYGRFLTSSGVGDGPDFAVTEPEFDNNQHSASGKDRWVVVGMGYDKLIRIRVVTATGPAAGGDIVISGMEGGFGPSVAYNAAVDEFLVAYRRGGDWNDADRAKLMVRRLSGAGVPLGDPIMIGDAPKGPRPRVASVGGDGYVIVGHTFDDKIFALQLETDVTKSGELTIIAETDDTFVRHFRPSVTARPSIGDALITWWGSVAPAVANDPEPTNVYLATIVTGDPVITDTNTDTTATSTGPTWVAIDGAAPQLAPGAGVWQRADGSLEPLVVTAAGTNQLRYAADGLTVTLTGGSGSGPSRGLVANANGEIVCEICALLVAGEVIEAWMFSDPRLVAAWRIENLPCQRFAIPVGAPMDGAGPVVAGTHTLQLALPTASGMQAVNVGVTVGGVVPTSVPAGEGRGVPGGPLAVAVGFALVAGMVARRRAFDRVG
jgi:hypothetical protein